MTTKLKSETARINGARSRGPASREGKRTSAQNSTRHGMLAQTIVLDGESNDLFQQLLAALTAEIQPRTPIESALVETLTVARWRQMRTWASGARPTRFALVFRNLADNSRVLDLVHRYETAFDRQFSRALALILKLRSSPLNELDPAEIPSFSGANLTWEPAAPSSPDTNFSNATNFPNEPTTAHPESDL